MRTCLPLCLICVLVVAGCGSKSPTLPDGGAEHPEHADAGGGKNDGGATGSGGRGPATDAGIGDGGAGTFGSDGGPGGVAPCDGPLLPMAVGNSWTYKVTHPVNGVSTKTTVVDKMQVVGGTGPNAAKMAFHVITMKTSGGVSDTSESWQDVLSDDTVVRYRELAYAAGSTTPNGEDYWDPYKLRVDNAPAHTVKAAAWDEIYTETKVAAGTPTSASRKDGWVVDDVDVACGPVQGAMLSCIKFSKKVDGAASGKSYWYARCVGKVREEGAQTEELTDYTVK